MLTVDDRLISQELGIVETSPCGISTELTDFWISGIFSGFNRRQCVRDWSGILCEHFKTTDNGQQTTDFFERGENKSEQRYSGKPDAKRNAQKEDKRLRTMVNRHCAYNEQQAKF